jgi:hypothetical protein
MHRSAETSQRIRLIRSEDRSRGAASPGYFFQKNIKSEESHMKAVRLKMVDGTECLAIPGVGIALPARDQAGHIMIGQILLLPPGMPPMPVNETLDTLEEKFNGAVASRILS